MLRGAARLLRVSAAGDAGAARSALESRGCAVVSVEQHREQGRFFERVAFDAGNGLDAGALEAALAPDVVTIRAADERPRLAVFAGKEPGSRGSRSSRRRWRRYMQILGPAFCEAYAGRALNVHHSLLPAFPGARPYDAAWARGVKLVGATAHYVTEELDGGPIVAQAALPAPHALSVRDLRRAGAAAERSVLADAVAAHVDRRVLIAGSRCVVFAGP
ncbi:phosphoribosylglycinamide formyltransferase [Aureococcus anophagefferens]|nr:phosphoribosylglycinamide formyltransferase [Aureococcus anophagefferens]